MNGQMVLQSEKVPGENHNTEDNILLMNSRPDPERLPMHGAVTDVNIWRGTLTQAQISDWMFCEREETGGDSDLLLGWETAELRITGLHTFQLNRSETCAARSNKTIRAFNHIKDFDETSRFCQNIGGVMAVALDQQTAARMNRSIFSVCETNKYFFSGHTDRQTEGRWVDVNTGSALSWGSLVGGKDLDCSVVTPYEGKLVGAFCYEGKCPVCEMNNNNRTLLQLSGVCDHITLDRFYVLKNSTELVGVSRTRISVSSPRHRWEIVEGGDDIIAFTNDSTYFPLGKQRWYFVDGKCRDQEDQTYRTLSLHLDVEQPGKFCCDDGACIDSELVCNNYPDCLDRSDEERNCSTLILPEFGFNKDLPAFGVIDGGKIPLPITTVVTIHDIFDINESDSFFDIKFTLTLKWFDKNIRFQFLKKANYENALHASYTDRFWTPHLMFYDVKDMNMMVETRKYFVERNGSPTLMEDGVTEVYEGSENPVSLVLKRRMIFICSFDSKNYPFASQNCSFEFGLDGADYHLTELELDGLHNHGPATFGKFVVKNWELQSKQFFAGKTIKVTLTLNRRITSIFMVTYLPTILMNLINQATNYITGEDKYSLIYTINITCMMVLASVYLSVSSSLPSTANIKPVEIWLLFNLAFPLIIILVNILLQVTGYLDIKIKKTLCSYYRHWRKTSGDLLRRSNMKTTQRINLIERKNTVLNCTENRICISTKDY